MPLRIFPVAAPTTFTNDFAAPRSGGRTHEGNDLFAGEGAPLVAVDDGEVRFGTDPLGGNVANLRAPDGTRYYYAHLSAYSGVNRTVRAGEVIGYMGHTGNAANTPTHLHFEVHPSGGPAVNPYPLLAAAPRTDTATSKKGLSPLPALLIAAALGLGAWAYMNPAAARGLARRLLPG